jgi:hypothetical protein
MTLAPPNHWRLDLYDWHPAAAVTWVTEIEATHQVVLAGASAPGM